MFVTPGRMNQPGEFMSGRGVIACGRCKDLIRKDKMVKVIIHSTPYRGVHNEYFCKHCRSVMLMQLRELEKIALLSD